MIQKSLGLLAVTAVLLVLGGCVAKSDYLQKQAEADAVSRDVAALTMENRNLKKRIISFQDDIKGLQERINVMDAEKENLNAERNALNTLVKTLREETSRTIEELRTRNTELEGDKQMLEESIALLKKSKDELINRNTGLESDKQMLEESIASLKKQKETEVITVSGTYEELLTEMKGEIEQGQIAITELQGKLTVDVLDRILFDSGRAEVKPEGLAVLKRVVEILRTAADKEIRIEGHTDNVPIAGTLAQRYPTNWELSAARALNVTRYLEKEGIDPSILSAVAYGEYQPVAENDTPEGRAKNRRIAITLMPMKK